MATGETAGEFEVPGASCVTGPSPSAKATRIDKLRAESPAALAELVGGLGDGPLDIALSPEDELVPLLKDLGFTPYSETATVARRIDGFRKDPAPQGVRIEPYRNEWAESFTRAEAAAMEDFSLFKEVGSPTGFETAEGWGTFLAARRGEEIVGFVQAEMPTGWINWIGVVPSERRKGIGRTLVGEIAIAVRDAVGSHLCAEIDDTPEAGAFWKELGFTHRTRLVSLIRR